MLPIEIWEMIADYPGTHIMLTLNNSLRAAWLRKNPSTSNPHVAFVRRKPCDVVHMQFCIALEKELSKCPERQLSCWNYFKVRPFALPPNYRDVVLALLKKLNKKAEEHVTLDMKTNGILVRYENGPFSSGRERPRPVLPTNSYDQRLWCLYIRTLLIFSQMEGRHNRFPTIHNNKLVLRKPKIGSREIHVLRSRRGLHGLSYTISGEKPPRGAFDWILSGILQDGQTLNVTCKNKKHPYSCLIGDTYKPVHSDVFSYAATEPKMWP